MGGQDAGNGGYGYRVLDVTNEEIDEGGVGGRKVAPSSNPLSGTPC